MKHPQNGAEHPAKPKALWLGPTLLIAALIAFLTLTDPVRLSPVPAGNDKIYHLLAFSSLVFPTALLRPRMILAVAALSLIYGGAIELVQPAVGRSADFGDMLANAAGVGLGILVGSAIRRVVVRPN